MENQDPPYGHLDTSYKAAGEEPGIRQLCTDFYKWMETLPEAQHIRQMHKDDLSVIIDKLSLFLCMWLGGPKTYRIKYPFQGMPVAHQHLVINEPEKNAWLKCMDKAIDEQPFADSFKVYLKEQIRFPAEMIRKTARSS